VRSALRGVGTSGASGGRPKAIGMMIGGERENVDYLRPIFATLAPLPTAAGGASGPTARHFVKMVHNGIEYGLMEAYAEGFE